MNSDDYRNLLDDLYGDPDDGDSSDDRVEFKAVVVDFTIGQAVLFRGHPTTGFSSIHGWVTEIRILDPGAVRYRISWSDTRRASWHSAIELHGISDD